jgi:c-di-GMP-binding flagellar brake protein YcgR
VPVFPNPKDLSIHDAVTVEADLFGLPIALTAFVTNVLSDELWLATRLPDDRIGRIRAGQSIHLTFERDGAMILESTFLRRLGESSKFEMQKSRVFAVRRPAGVESSQRRAHVRADLERTVRVRSMGALGEKIGSGKTLNIGAGGLLFVTTMPFLYGEELRLAIALSSRDIIIAGGTVVRIEDCDDRPRPGGPDGPGRADGGEARSPCSKVAVRFDKISEVDQERVTCYILQVHRQRRTASAGLAALPEAMPDDAAFDAAENATGPESADGAAPTSPPDEDEKAS